MTMVPPRFIDNDHDGDITATNNHEIVLDLARAHDDNGSNDDDHPNIVMDTVKMTTTEHVHQEVKSTNHEEEKSEYHFFIDDNELFDESHHLGQQRRHHHHRRHSHPELRSSEQEVGGIFVKDCNPCLVTTSSWKNYDDDDGNDLMTAAAAAAAPSIASDSTFASRPVLPTAIATTHAGLTDTNTTKSSSSNNDYIINKKKRSNISIPLSSLPIDALQAISTYCTPSDWYSLSSTSQHWRYGIGSEVFGRVRRHAGLCAFEVGMAWAMGEHADARELACLYISKGVPIYPAPRGHAYHTLAWRMGLELSSSTATQMGHNGMVDVNPVAVAASAAAVLDTEERIIVSSEEIDGDVNANEVIVFPPLTVDEFYSCLYLDGADGSNMNTDEQRNTDAGLRRRLPNGRGGNRRRNLRNLLSSRDQVLSLTYVEEKSLFWKRKKGIEQEGSTLTNIDTTPWRLPFAPQPLLAPLLVPPQQQHPATVAAPQAAPLVERELVESIVAASPSSSLLLLSSNSVPDLRSLLVEEDDALFKHDLNTIPRDHMMRATMIMHNEVVAPKMTMRVHRHLADQHVFRSPSVDDEKGTMTAGKMSMNADFFHPTWEGRKGVTTMYDRMNNFDGYWDEGEGRESAADGHIQHDQAGMEGFGVIDEAHQLAYRESMESNVEWALSNHGQTRRLSLPILSNGRAHHPRSTARHSSLRFSAPRLASPASDVHLEIYSCSAANLKMDNERDTAIGVAIGRMRSRCQHYQQRFDALLKNSFDAICFQECLLDFWDEIFPTSAGIHFYNRQAAVPRMSLLHEFVMKPIPKALGTMEYQIERVRITGKNNKAAAKRVKGRFFPKYEYRLFVRDTTSDNPFHPSPRKDSVLLVAKNKRGKNSIVASSMRESSSHRGGNGVGGIDLATPVGLSSHGNGGTSKRGMSNYYLCLPQQCDVDNHYKSVNTQGEGESSSLDLSPLAMQNRHPIEVGRLQSNFIGTEFQIFLPNTFKAMQVEEQDTESECVHDLDNQSMPRRRSMSRKGGDLVRFAQRSFSISGRGISGRNSSNGNESADEPIDMEESDESLHDQQKKKKHVVRRMSWGTNPNPSKWTNRRAIANNDSSLRELSTSVHSLLPRAGILAIGESEGGAITYTANLLGNRPRMMDVCIPKLMENGRVCAEWRKEQLNSSISNTVSMLDRFKNILYTLNSDEVDSADVSDTNGNQGLMLLQNRPPWWNVELGAFVLNFGGRVKVASVKNFQLCERNVQEHIMQFGRIEGRHAFTMDFQYPLSPLQAFAIAISSLQSKISFG